jgi:hypothetical protein
MILGGVLGLFVGAIISGLIAAGVVAALGADASDMVFAIAPFGGMLGMGIGATWLLLRSDKKR